MPVRKTIPDKTHNNLQRHMFHIHVALQSLGTVHYLPLLLVTSFLRNYYGGRGRPARSLYSVQPILEVHFLAPAQI